MTPKIVPAMLPVDYARLGDDCVALEKGGADRLQWDIMDGQFVPNITYGPDVIAACRPLVSLGFEAHVMCRDPEWMVPKLVDAGCDIIIVHVEAMRQPHATYQAIRKAGARAAIALSPATPVSYIENVLDLVDLVLIMTVNPGFGGQAYISTMEPKIAAARAMIDAGGFDVEIEVDGGIGPDTIAGAAAAGASVFVSGSALWKYESFGAGVTDLRQRATEAAGG
ncbi:MAG: ribulose-phosphate 3-epimerase [Egibacteraceae bacterium]